MESPFADAAGADDPAGVQGSSGSSGLRPCVSDNTYRPVCRTGVTLVLAITEYGPAPGKTSAMRAAQPGPRWRTSTTVASSPVNSRTGPKSSDATSILITGF